MWCNKFCCEEDIDWAIRPVEGKGVGIFALKTIPRFSRVLVDGMRNHDDPGIMDLLPVGATRQAKIALNAYSSYRDGKEVHTLYLRGSRINHSCSPTCFSMPDHGIYCTVVVADMDICVGEEVTVAYLSFNE